MLTEASKLEVLKLAVDRANREHPVDFQATVAEIYTRFYNLIDGDSAPGKKPTGKAKADAKGEPEIFG